MGTQQIIRIDTTQIADEEDLHRLFAERLGFLAGYGIDCNAWIDCMGYLDSPWSKMTTVNLGPDDALVVHLEPPGDLKKRQPQVFEDLLECTGFVNWRRVSKEGTAQLTPAFYP